MGTKNVQMPDGTVVEFPDDMPDEKIAAVLKAQHPAADAGRSWGDILADVGRGIGKGAVHTMSMADDWATQHLPAVMTTPIGQTPSHENSVKATQYAHDLAQTHNTAQAVGKGVEQAAEFLAPTGIEEGLAKFAGAAASRFGAAAGRAGAVVGRLTGAGVHSGAINSAQGGSFGAGATGGVIGSVAGQAIQKIAPTLAEIAIGTRAIDRAAGRTPGAAILSETKGVDPGKIASQAYKQVGSLTGKMESSAMSAPGTASLQAARDEARSWYEAALLRNEPSAIKATKQIMDQVEQWSSAAGAGNVAPIPTDISPMQMLRMRRGMGDVPGSWNPATTTDFSSRAAKAVYGKLGDEVSRTVPGADALDDRISSLMPAANRAGAVDLNAGVAQRVIGKMARPTGALLGTVSGATAGYKLDSDHPFLGAAMGGAVGAVAPEILTSPKTLMTLARGADGIVQKGIPAAVGAGLQATREDPPMKGAAKWAQLGQAKLTDHIGRDASAGLSADDVQTLAGTGQGKTLLVQASDLSPGSPAMKDLARRAKLLLSQEKVVVPPDPTRGVNQVSLPVWNAPQ